jgi:glycosyltransferase involved in cell wall biosynthesis
MAYKILHIITTLSMGGAESMLYKLLTRVSNKNSFNHRVVSLSGPGYYGALLEQRGIAVHSLSLDAGAPTPKDLFEFYTIVKKWNPHAIQTWLYHADLIGLLLARFINVRKILWNIRCSNMDLAQYPATTRWVFSLLTKLSRSPDVIITNSKVAKKHHVQSGYTPKRWEIIPNGFDTDCYRPDNEARKRMRHALGIDETSLVIGMTARYDPMKDHGNFLRAAGKVSATLPDVRFVLIGKGVDENNPDITDMIKKNGLSGKVHLLGERTDLPNIYPAFDIFTLTSLFGEGFPNVLGEAMACGVPCVATNTGDSSDLIGNTGKIVPPRNHDAMAQAWMEMLSLSHDQRVEFGLMARERVKDRYSIDNIVQRYETLYSELLQ